MVLEVRAHGLILNLALDTGGLQYVWVSNPRQFENLRTLKSTTGNDDFASSFDRVVAATVCEVHTCRLVSIKLDGGH